MEEPKNEDAADTTENISVFQTLQTGNTAQLSGLLQSGELQVNAVDTSLCTPLHWSAFLNNLEASQLLLDHGADVNRQTSSRRMPLHEASSEGSLTLVQLLVARGAHINARDYSNRLPLHLACVNDNIDVAKYLISVGSELNVKAVPMLVTPLLEAMSFDHAILAELLVKSGSDVLATDKEGNDALMYYLRYRHSESDDLLFLLAQAGCQFTNKHVQLAKDMYDQNFELLAWIDDEIASPRSLLRQVRSAIRTWLFVSHCYIDIVPFLSKLPLPKTLVAYLMFSG